MYIGFYNSPIGILKIEADSESIILIDSDISSGEEKLNNLIINCKKELDEYFRGERKIFSIPFELNGTPFQKKVWEELLNIPYGETVSYKEVAKRIGNEKSVRAVANAIGKNKLVIIIPCHRVIGSNNSLTGFRLGIDKKRYLLDLEKN